MLEGCDPQPSTRLISPPDAPSGIKIVLTQRQNSVFVNGVSRLNNDLIRNSFPVIIAIEDGALERTPILLVKPNCEAIWSVLVVLLAPVAGPLCYLFFRLTDPKRVRAGDLEFSRI
jgi:hypothetical protein